MNMVTTEYSVAIKRIRKQCIPGTLFPSSVTGNEANLWRWSVLPTETLSVHCSQPLCWLLSLIMFQMLLRTWWPHTYLAQLKLKVQSLCLATISLQTSEHLDLTMFTYVFSMPVCAIKVRIGPACAGQGHILQLAKAAVMCMHGTLYWNHSPPPILPLNKLWQLITCSQNSDGAKRCHECIRLWPTASGYSFIGTTKTKSHLVETWKVQSLEISQWELLCWNMVGKKLNKWIC